MKRLDFVLPDFARVAWTSDVARDVWEARIERVVAAWLEIEWRAVVAGERRCAIATVSPEALVARGAQWAEHGLTPVALELLGVSGQMYSATPTPVQPGGPVVIRMALGRPADAAAFRAAFDAADDEAIGDLLGYPECCREFFRATWVDEMMVDTTWPMARGLAAVRAAAREARSDVPPGDGRVGAAPGGDAAERLPVEVVDDEAAGDEVTEVEVSGPALANILWRWMGVRAVPHLPCSFTCAPTVDLAERLVRVGRESGFGEEMDWLVEILSWPVEWSALHGIAEIKTPVLRVSTRTDATATKYTVRRRGDRFPAEGARGLTFAFDTPVRLRLTGTPGYRRGLAHGGQPSPPAWLATDNGFASVAAMDAAHAPIVAAALAALDGAGGRVVDLGCGNGALLAKLVAADPAIEASGVEADAVRVEHAGSLHAGGTGRFVHGDLFDAPELWCDGPRFALALVMPGRLLEVDPGRAAALRAWLRERCEKVLVYAYGDWLDVYDGLTNLAQRAGFDVPVEEGGVGLVASVRARVPEAGDRHGT